MYAKNAISPQPMIHSRVTGVQNRKILSDLLLIRLAAKNKMKKEIAIIQNPGEKRVPKAPMSTAASPVAFDEV
jgi:hypothetical protein